MPRTMEPIGTFSAILGGAEAQFQFFFSRLEPVRQFEQ